MHPVAATPTLSRIATPRNQSSSPRARVACEGRGKGESGIQRIARLRFWHAATENGPLNEGQRPRCRGVRAPRNTNYDHVTGIERAWRNGGVSVISPPKTPIRAIRKQGGGGELSHLQASPARASTWCTPSGKRAQLLLTPGDRGGGMASVCAPAARPPPAALSAFVKECHLSTLFTRFQPHRLLLAPIGSCLGSEALLARFTLKVMTPSLGKVSEKRRTVSVLLRL